MATTSFKSVLLHLLIILILCAGIIAGFFYWYLPSTTNHGETVQVPKLVGLSLKQAETFLDEKSLRYEVSDCTYVKDKKPMTILSQYPRSGTEVKENRRIYVSIAALSPPKVKMPNLIDASLKNAQLVLKSYDLILGPSKAVPHFAKNAVLKQFYNNREIKPGTYIPKGSTINVHYGDGLGSAKVVMPDLIGLSYSEAGRLLEDLQLQMGSESWDESSTEEAGTIIKQKPTFVGGDSIQKGQIIDVWIAGSDPKKHPTEEKAETE